MTGERINWPSSEEETSLWCLHLSNFNSPLHKYLLKVTQVLSWNRGEQTSRKSQKVNTLGFAEYTFSIVTIQSA